MGNLGGLGDTLVFNPMGDRVTRRYVGNSTALAGTLQFQWTEVFYAWKIVNLAVYMGALK
uniref:Uncharacterized protein n=1 Tax=Romanomermis culicivorax TaxID=13658 RepID=A0A915JU65_ROMCU